MTSIAFDTHDAVKTLRNAGVDERSAEAMVEVMKRTTDLPRVDHLATKADIAELRTEIAKVEGRLVWWVIGSGVISTFGQALLRQLGLLG